VQRQTTSAPNRHGLHTIVCGTFRRCEARPCRSHLNWLLCAARIRSSGAVARQQNNGWAMPATVTEKPPRREGIAMLGDAVAAMDALLADARRAVGERVTVDGQVVSRRFDSEQRATHGLAWLATYVEAIRQLAHYAQALADGGTFGEIEELL